MAKISHKLRVSPTTKKTEQKSMKLHFDKKRVDTIWENSWEAKSWGGVYGDTPERGDLVLVGDDGVYLMSANLERFLDPDKPETSFIAYAHEANPETMDFDTWWSNKRESFGCDDGADKIPDRFYREMLVLGVDYTAYAMEIDSEGMMPCVPDKKYAIKKTARVSPKTKTAK